MHVFLEPFCSKSPLHILLEIRNTYFSLKLETCISNIGNAQVTYGAENSEQKQGIERIRHSILEILPPEPRKVEGKFLMSVDHCFPVKGHGTVLTGTVLQASPPRSLLEHLKTFRGHFQIRSEDFPCHVC